MAPHKNSGKLPSFPFYPKDWMDYKVQRMPDESQGIYLRLLCNIWTGTSTQFSIENNDKLLARVLHLSLRKWRKVKSHIQHPGDPCLIEENGQLISKKLRKIKQDYELLREKRRQAALKRHGFAGANDDAKGLQTPCKGDAKGLQEGMQKGCLSPSLASSLASKEEGDGSSKSVSDADGEALPSFSKQELKQAEELFWQAWQELHCRTWETPDEYLPTPFEKRDTAQTITPANLERYIAYAWYYHQRDAKVGIQPGKQVPGIDKFFKAAAVYCSKLREGNELWQQAKSWSQEFLAERRDLISPTG